MTSPRGSVVIPAHDDGPRVARCLAALLAEAPPGEWEVCVVANGCSDDTAEQVRALGRADVQCVEISTASKIAALNAGDAAVSTFPRLYLDADVVVDTAAAQRLRDVLASGEVLAAAPRLRYDLRGVGVLTRRYVRVLEGLPVFDRSYVGSGCYALSALGRSRFGAFPDVIGDDRYVNDLFAPAEKRTLVDHPMIVAPPRDLRSVIRRSLRVKAGSLALQADPAPRPTTPPEAVPASPLPSLRRHLVREVGRGRVLDVVVFVAVQVVVTVTARVRRARGRDQQWLRHESSRG